jgi:hypothetical protein
MEQIICLESDAYVPLKISLPFLSRQVEVGPHRISWSNMLNFSAFIIFKYIYLQTECMFAYAKWKDKSWGI